MEEEFNALRAKGRASAGARTPKKLHLMRIQQFRD